jgi:hypothetical protein
MTKKQTLELIEDRIMMLVMAGAQREEDGSPVYEDRMINFAISALQSLYGDIEGAA